jgi:hypothetical protein
LRNYDDCDLIITLNEPAGYQFETLKKFKEAYNRFPLITVDVVINVVVYCLGDEKIYNMKSSDTI